MIIMLPYPQIKIFKIKIPMKNLKMQKYCIKNQNTYFPPRAGKWGKTGGKFGIVAGGCIRPAKGEKKYRYSIKISS